MFSPKGLFLRTFGKEGYGLGEMQYPAGLSVDLEDKIYVCENIGERIQIFNSRGEALRHFAPIGFNHPWGIVVDREGRIVVMDTWNHRIQIISGMLSLPLLFFCGWSNFF